MARLDSDQIEKAKELLVQLNKLKEESEGDFKPETPIDKSLYKLYLLIKDRSGIIEKFIDESELDLQGEGSTEKILLVAKVTKLKLRDEWDFTEELGTDGCTYRQIKKFYSLGNIEPEQGALENIAEIQDDIEKELLHTGYLINTQMDLDDNV